jgi:hypothetical protein
MQKKFFTFSRRTLFAGLEITAMLVGLVALAGSIFFWRLTTGPLSVDFAKSYIEEALRDPVSGYSVTLGHVSMNWPDHHGPILLNLKDITLIKNGQTVVEIGGVDVGLVARRLVVGRIKPVSIVLSNPALHVIRTADNRIRLDVEGEDLPPPEQGQDEAESPLMQILGTVAQPPGKVDKRSPLDRLESLDIKDAQMIVEDHVIGVTWFLPHLDLLFVRTAEGLGASANLDIPGGRDQAGHIQVGMTYYRDSGDVKVGLNVQDFDPRVLAHKVRTLDWLDKQNLVLNGTIDFTADSQLTVKTLSADVTAQDGALALKGIYDNPVPFQALGLQASYDRAAGKISVKNLSVKAADIAITAATEATITDGRLTAPVRMQIPELRPESLKKIWPDMLRGEGAEEWLTVKMTNGAIKNAALSVDLDAAQAVSPHTGKPEWIFGAHNIAAGFDIENMDIDYRPPLAPAQHLNGKGTYANDTIDIDVAGAKIGGLDAKSGHILLNKVSVAKEGTADIKMNLAGPLPAVFHYIADEPIGMNRQKINVDADKVKGAADLAARVQFPLLKDLKTEQVVVTVDGKFDNAYLPGVVKNLDLADADIKVKVDDGALTLSGKGKLDGRPVDMTWMQYLVLKGKPFSSQLNADIRADADLRHKFGIGLTDWLAGEVPLHVVYTEHEGADSTAEVTADLTPATLTVNPFYYEKAPGTAGKATCKAVLSHGDIRDVQNLNIQTPDLTMTGGQFNFEGNSVLRSGGIDKIAMTGGTDINLQLQVAPDGVHKIVIGGASFDAVPYLKHKKTGEPYTGPALLVSASVGKMRTFQDRTVQNAKMYMAMDRAGDVNQFELDAVAGKGAIYTRLKPDSQGRMTLRLEADDAGAALRAFGVYENARGGKLVIQGAAPRAADRKHLTGTAQMTEFNVVKAPVLAQLLSAISLFGITDLLGNDGIHFAKLESKFAWDIRPKGDLYTFTEGRTSGASLGLTFEGQVDRASGLTDISGTIVPVSMVNEMVSNIPVIGDILAGGKGGAVIAATYTVKGPSESPVTSVNPLAALTPGILRRILFEDSK